MNKVKSLFVVILLFFYAFPSWAENTGARATYLIYFDAFASTPRSESIKTLETIKKKVSEDKGLIALIEGHSDASEVKKGDSNPTGLSRMRSEFVANWLASALGGSFSREVKSYGSSVPAVKTGTFPGLFRNSSDNRRVEVKLYTRDSLPKEGSAAMPVSGNAPRFFVKDMEFTFKEVYEGESVIHDFIVQNQGKAPLEIIDVKPG
ncbi:MAG: hypothetical protein WC799_23395 [Desulfobacteraceae bacterium]|jgi:hypothetical protein